MQLVPVAADARGALEVGHGCQRLLDEFIQGRSADVAERGARVVDGDQEPLPRICVLHVRSFPFFAGDRHCSAVVTRKW